LIPAIFHPCTLSHFEIGTKENNIYIKYRYCSDEYLFINLWAEFLGQDAPDAGQGRELFLLSTRAAQAQAIHAENSREYSTG
jgi:hypothetical protein